MLKGPGIRKVLCDILPLLSEHVRGVVELKQVRLYAYIGVSNKTRGVPFWGSQQGFGSLGSMLRSPRVYGSYHTTLTEYCNRRGNVILLDIETLADLFFRYCSHVDDHALRGTDRNSHGES